MENNELQHHGTKGMKWGQRLYQNKDGSLTALGRARLGYKKRQAVKKRQATVKAKAKAAEEKKKTAEEIAKEKERVLKSRSAKELYDKAPLFDDAELNKAYQRLVLEKNIKSLVPEEVSKGKKFVNAVIEGSGNISKLVGFANAIDNNFGQIVKRHATKNSGDDDGSGSSAKSSSGDTSKKEKTSFADKMSKAAGMKKNKGSNDDDDGPLTGTVMGEGTSRVKWDKNKAPTYEGIFTDHTRVPASVKRFVANEDTLASTVTDLVSGNTNLLSVGRQFLLEESRKD